ncbi:hypothetical protein SAMN04515618_10646 [Collimonas sp. OK307]|nr:hypothetical protein SAMN04515618_10646 [Collimonas sp. OK307]
MSGLPESQSCYSFEVSSVVFFLRALQQEFRVSMLLLKKSLLLNAILVCTLSNHEYGNLPICQALKLAVCASAYRSLAIYDIHWIHCLSTELPLISCVGIHDDVSDVKAMIKANLIAERIGDSDPTTRHMLVGIMVKEGEHADDMRDLLA